MIYNNAVDQIKGMKPIINIGFRLAKVSSLSNGRAYVKFYGETTASSKLYPYIEGYKPVVGDDVLLAEQGSTFIIIGKISKTNIVDNYNLTKTVADGIYLTISAAASTYLTEAVADNKYQPKGTGSDKIQNNSYYFGFSSSSGNTLVANTTGSGTSPCNLGSTSYPFNNGYFTTLGNAASASAVQTLNVKNVNLYGDIVPDTNNSRALGSSSKKFSNVYTEALNISTVIATKWQPSSSYSYGINATSGSSSGTFTPSSSGNVHLGTASAKFGDGYFTTLGGASASNAIQTLNVKDTNIYGSTLPGSTTTYDLGSSSKRFKNIYGQYLRADYLYFGTNANVNLHFDASASTPVIYPYTTNKINIGSSSYQFNSCYAKQYYQNGTAISTSDKRKKTNIKDIAKKYIDFFKRLKPRSFRFKDGESGRTHTGFIAQEVEEAAAESGINNKDLAFICIDEEGNYGLRYEELIAIQTQVIQDLMARVERLENIVKERA